MDEAMCIPINELSVEDVYYMIAGNGGIVDLIIEGKTINEIVEGVNDMGEERRNKDRPFNKYVQNANEQQMFSRVWLLIVAEQLFQVIFFQRIQMYL